MSNYSNYSKQNPKFWDLGHWSFFRLIRSIRIIRLIVFFFALSILISQYLGSALAQSLSLSLWPPLLEVMIQPGRTITQVYKLTNNSDHALAVTPVIYPFEPMGEDGTIRIKNQAASSKQQATNSKQQSNYFSFDTGEKIGQPFDLAVGQTKEIVLKVTIPRNNPEADYYYTLLFSTSVAPTEALAERGQNQTFSITQIGSNILLTTSLTGKPPLLGRIIEFSTPTIIDSFSKTDFEVVLENWGKTFFKPFGKIKIKGILNQKDEIPLLEQNILANSSRRLTTPTYKPKLPFGPFKATLEFTLSQTGDPENATSQKLISNTTFWYLPYKLSAGLVALMLLLVIVKKLIKR